MNTDLVSFSNFFNQYRLRAGFRTLGEFGKSLAEEGYVYEDSIFSKWRKGERIPRDRDVILAICRTFTTRQAIEDADAINKTLQCLGLRDLSAEEMTYLALSKLHNYPEYFSQYAPIREPSTLFHKVTVSEQNTRLLEVATIPEREYRNYWQHESYCAAAGYYSLVSDGKPGPTDFFESYIHD